MNEKQKIEYDLIRLEEGMYKGKKLKDMTRQELYEALYNFDGLYRRELNSQD